MSTLNRGRSLLPCGVRREFRRRLEQPSHIAACMKSAPIITASCATVSFVGIPVSPSSEPIFCGAWITFAYLLSSLRYVEWHIRFSSLSDSVAYWCILFRSSCLVSRLAVPATCASSANLNHLFAKSLSMSVRLVTGLSLYLSR